MLRSASVLGFTCVIPCFRFDAFDMESHGECRYDRVEITEGDLGGLLGAVKVTRGGGGVARGSETRGGLFFFLEAVKMTQGCC